MAEKWTREQTEVLIDACKEEECLYAVRNPNYHNKKLRTAALKRVMDRVVLVRPDTNEQQCQKKIHSLRNQFNIESSKSNASIKSGVGTDNLYEPSLWYFKSLLFLEDHVTPRKSTSTYLAKKTAVDSAEDSDETHYSESLFNEDGQLIVYPLDDSNDSSQSILQAFRAPHSPLTQASDSSQNILPAPQHSQTSSTGAEPSRAPSTVAAGPSQAPSPASRHSQTPSPVPGSRTPSPAHGLASTAASHSNQSSASEETLMPPPKKKKSSQVDEPNVPQRLKKIDKYMDVPVPVPPCKAGTQPGNRILSTMKYVTDSLLSMKDKRRQMDAMHDILQSVKDAEFAEMLAEH